MFLWALERPGYDYNHKNLSMAVLVFDHLSFLKTRVENLKYRPSGTMEMKTAHLNRGVSTKYFTKKVLPAIRDRFTVKRSVLVRNIKITWDITFPHTEQELSLIINKVHVKFMLWANQLTLRILT